MGQGQARIALRLAEPTNSERASNGHVPFRRFSVESRAEQPRFELLRELDANVRLGSE